MMKMSDPELDGGIDAVTLSTEEDTELSSAVTDDGDGDGDGEKRLTVSDGGCGDDGHGDGHGQNFGHEDDDDDVMVTRELLGIVLDFLHVSGLEETYKILRSECESGGYPLPVPIPISHLEGLFNPRDAHLLYKYFDTEQSDELLTQWAKLITCLEKNSSRAQPREFQKITFFLRIFATVIPFRKNESRERKAKALTDLRAFFQEKSEEFATDEKMLSLFALPFVQDPAQHPVFREIFQDSWKSKLRAQICLSVNKFWEIQNSPTVQSSTLAQYYFTHQRSMWRQRGQGGNSRDQNQNQHSSSKKSLSKYNKQRCASRLETPTSVRSFPNDGDQVKKDDDDDNDEDKEGVGNDKDRDGMSATSDTIESLHENLRNVESTLLDVELRYHKLLKVTAEMVAALEAAVQGRDQDMTALQSRVTSVFPELFTAFSFPNTSCGGPHPRLRPCQDQGQCQGQSSDKRRQAGDSEEEVSAQERSQRTGNGSESEDAYFEETYDPNYHENDNDRDRDRDPDRCFGSEGGTSIGTGVGQDSDCSGVATDHFSNAVQGHGQGQNNHGNSCHLLGAARVESEETITDVDVDLDVLNPFGSPVDDGELEDEMDADGDHCDRGEDDTGNGDGRRLNSSRSVYISPNDYLSKPPPSVSKPNVNVNVNHNDASQKESYQKEGQLKGQHSHHRKLVRKNATTFLATENHPSNSNKTKPNFKTNLARTSNSNSRISCHQKNLNNNDFEVDDRDPDSHTQGQSQSHGQGQGDISHSHANKVEVLVSGHPSTCQMPPVPPFRVAKAKSKDKDIKEKSGQNSVNSHNLNQGQGQHRNNDIQASSSRSSSKKRNYVNSMQGSRSKLTLSNVAPTPRSMNDKLRSSVSANVSSTSIGRCQGQGQLHCHDQGQCQSQSHAEGQNQSQGQRRRWATCSSTSIISSVNQWNSPCLPDPVEPSPDGHKSSNYATSVTNSGQVQSQSQGQHENGGRKGGRRALIGNKGDQ